MITYYRLELPFQRWWSNEGEDFPAEHIEEIVTDKGLEWELVTDVVPLQLSPKHIIFYADAFFTSQNQVIKCIDDQNTYYYIYSNCNSAMSREGDKIIFEVNFVLDEWMSHILQRIRNNKSKQTNVWAINQHMNRFLYDAPRNRWYVDYKNQPWLRSPNTAIQIQTEMTKQSLTLTDYRDDDCYFIWSENQLSLQTTSGNRPLTYDIQNMFRDTPNPSYPDDPVNLGIAQSPTLSPEQKKYQAMYNYIKPIGEGRYQSYGGAELGDDFRFEHGAVRSYENQGWFWGSDYTVLQQQDWLKNNNYKVKWGDVDDMFEYSRDNDDPRLPNNRHPVYRYAVIEIVTANQRVQDGQQPELTFKYYDENGTVATDNMGAKSGFNIVIPIMSPRNPLKVKYQAPRSYGSWNCGPFNTNEMVTSLDNIGAFINIVKHNLAISSIGFSEVTTMPPSVVGGLMKEHTNIDPASSENPYNRIYMTDPADGVVKLYAGMHLYYGTQNKTVNANPGASRDFYDPQWWASDYCPYFIMTKATLESAFTELEDKNLMFFEEFNTMLNNANSESYGCPVTEANEPLLKSPLYFNFQYYMANDGDGTITADMLDWDRLSGPGHIGHVNLISDLNDASPNWSAIYLWDMESCLNKNYESSPLREQCIFTNKMLSKDSSAYAGYEANGWTGGARTNPTGMVKDAAEATYRAGSSIFDANETQQLVKNNTKATSKEILHAEQGLRNAKGAAITGIANVGINAIMSAPKIFGQRCTPIAGPKAYGTPPFCAEILQNLENKGNEYIFATSHLVPTYATALFAYHCAYGYYYNSITTFDKLDNRQCFNYAKLDAGWNPVKILNDSLDGLSPFYKTVEEGREYLDRLTYGFRIHESKRNNYLPWDIDESMNHENRLTLDFDGDFSDWDVPQGSSETREYTFIFGNAFTEDYNYTIKQIYIDLLNLATGMTYEYDNKSLKITWTNNEPSTPTNTFNISASNVVSVEEPSTVVIVANREVTYYDNLPSSLYLTYPESEYNIYESDDYDLIPTLIDNEGQPATATYTCSTPDDLPDGITLDENTGIFSVRPGTRGSSQTSQIVTATGTGEWTGMGATFTIEFVCTTPTSITMTYRDGENWQLTTNVPYDSGVPTIVDNNGRKPHGQFQPHSLPPGLDGDSTTGEITGTITFEGQFQSAVNFVGSDSWTGLTTATALFITVSDSEGVE